MKVVLPDGTELELPDGATGLDAARAIGPKLAEQAVLVARRTASRRTCGCRSPTAQQIQILTTRDTHDPDALSVLRHSTAHLLAEAVRRLYPGVKVAIGPPIENGFYYDFEFPEPISEADLERDRGRGRARARRGARRGSARRSRATRRARGSRRRASRTRSSSSTRPRATISLYTQGDFTDLCRGPHLQDSAPIKAFKLTGARRRLLARRREQHAADADLRHRVLHAGRPRRAPRAARGGEGARPPPARHAARPVPLRRASPGSPFWHPKGMVIWNVLEDLRRRENARRGYVEVKTPLIYDKALWVTSGHWEKFRENMFLDPDRRRAHATRVKPMNCPGHMLLFGSQLRSYRDLPLRYAEAATLHRNELAGALHGLAARPARDPGRRAHLLHARSRSRPRSSAVSTTCATSTTCFGIEPRASSSRPGRTTSSAPTRSGTSPRVSSRAALERHEHRVLRRRG